MSVYLETSLTISTVLRRDILHTCNRCPTSDRNRFDRLKDPGGHNSSRSLEGHVKRAHPELTGDFKDYKGDPVYKSRMVNRRVQKTATKGAAVGESSGDEYVEDSDETELNRLSKMADELKEEIDVLKKSIKKTTQKPLAKEVEVRKEESPSEEENSDKTDKEDKDDELLC